VWSVDSISTADRPQREGDKLCFVPPPPPPANSGGSGPGGGSGSGKAGGLSGSGQFGQLPTGSPQPLQPAKLADFKLAGALGAGTTAKVYEAVHIATGRAVAIKVLEPQPSGSASEMRERFAREAILLAGVASRHVGNIVGFGFERGQPFLVLERLHGETLDAKLRRDGPVVLPTAVRWIEQLLVGVRDCHDQQIIHRDIKPSNIFLHREGFEETVKLIDFGVARLREITGDTAGLTSTNHLIGSMGYMAPEQFRNAKSVGFTADLYAVGVVIFRTLTGRLPFVSRSLEAVIKMKAEQTAPLVSTMPGMPKNVLLDWFVTKTMARDPNDRFQSTREMLEHWWNVMASLDEESTTDVMRGIGRVDESYAGPLRRSMRDAQVIDPGRQSLEAEEDRTIARPRADAAVGRMVSPHLQTATIVASGPLTSVPSTAPGPAPSSGGEMTLHDVRDAKEAYDSVPPNTEPTGGMGNPDDEFDLPTRSDPNLRKLVEQELELHRKRNPPSR
jgi:serine/threonine protein kinase